MSLKDRISDDMKAALKGGDKRRLGVIRLVHAAIKQREVDERTELDDGQVLVVLDKMAKQRRDSITQYRDGGREDLAEQEEYELELIQSYLPTPLSDDEIAAMIDEAIQSTGAAGPRDMGKVMGQLKPRLQGRADMSAVSGRVRQALGA